MPDWSGYRSMVFVDGENFTIRGQKFAQAHGLKLLQGRYWEPDTYLWLPEVHGEAPPFAGGSRASRAHYYNRRRGR
jgi:hypothetical protein